LVCQVFLRKTALTLSDCAGAHKGQGQGWAVSGKNDETQLSLRCTRRDATFSIEDPKNLVNSAAVEKVQMTPWQIAAEAGLPESGFEECGLGVASVDASAP
jgi:hypothetical protein